MRFPVKMTAVTDLLAGNAIRKKVCSLAKLEMCLSPKIVNPSDVTLKSKKKASFFSDIEGGVEGGTLQSFLRPFFVAINF